MTAVSIGVVTLSLKAQTALAPTPPMGWNSWNHFASKVTDADVRSAADYMVSSGMRDAGYVYVNIDDTWEGERDSKGIIHSNSKFPDMKALADYVHSKGLKLGIYSSPGPKTCALYEGSYGHEEQDAATYAAWGVDYLKYDMCSYSTKIMRPAANGDYATEMKMMRDAYEKMHQALLKTGRPIVYSFCQYGWGRTWEWGPGAGASLWRTGDDINDTWAQMTAIGFGQAGLSRFAGPGHWNDPDMLEVGNGRMKPDEYRTHMTLWAILAAPLIAGNDLSKMTSETVSILTNRDIIAVDQDPLGKQGDRVSAVGPLEVWSRPLADGDMAVAMFNRGDYRIPMSFDLADLGAKGKFYARNLWSGENVGRIPAHYEVMVPKHGVVILRLSRRAFPAVAVH